VAHKTEHTEESVAMPIPNLISAEFAEIGQKRVEAMMKLQQELFGRFAEFTQAWFARAKSEADLASEFVTKLTTARTVPETTTACQECVDKRMEMLVEDSRRLLEHSQKVLHMGTRLFMNGSAGNGS
jgi:uncharacterized protein with PIN domain